MISDLNANGAPSEREPSIAEPAGPRDERILGDRADVARLVREPGAAALGRLADSPAEIAWPGWRAVLRRTMTEMLTDRVALVAAGCAFYATLALFPAISMLISFYGLVFDPVSVVPQLNVIRDLLPPAGFQLIEERVRMLVSKPQGTLGMSLLFSTAVTFWSSAVGTKSIITALNLAYGERERRGFFAYQAITLAITLCVILGTALGLSLLVALPAVLDFLGIALHQRALIHAASFAMLVMAVLIGLSLACTGMGRAGRCRIGGGSRQVRWWRRCCGWPLRLSSRGMSRRFRPTTRCMGRLARWWA